MRGIFFRDFDADYIGHIVNECYKDRVYDQFLSGQDMTIVEAGGNVGAVTLYLSRFAKRLVVLEPCSAHQEVLRHTVQFNELHQVTVVPAALAATDADERLLHHTPGNTTSHSLVWGGRGGEVVRCLGMNTVLNEYQLDTVDFLKLDVEGSEFEIVASDSFRLAAPRIKSLAVECHDQRREAELEIGLAKAGYKVSRISHGPVLFGARRNMA